ncbi:hypothetical protein [Bacteroides sp. UBA939]|uniref:hypothetical protein n=1 Tax=Bacteroides sp. UBA939 TaxID=1946092 RepID=UPI0025C64837|nr:hypothetical protein [Bacteroides sp. UBA939]
MKKNICVTGILFLFLTLLYGCIEEETVQVIKDSNTFQISMSEGVTRSPESESILENMQLYCFSQDSNAPLSGNGGSWDSDFSHQLLGVTRTNMTLHTSQARAGDWDLAMVSAAGAVFTPPVANSTASEGLMYTYTPGEIQTDGYRSRAHEIWHRMLRLPTIDGNTVTATSTGITRNASMVRVVIDRAVDVDVDSDDHLFELRGVPDKISWSGTLLRTVSESPKVYETSLSNPDTLDTPLTGKFTFTDNSAVETGTYKSDMLTFIIPAHREADFWADATTPNTNVQDTITHKMKVFVSLTKASGGKFEKEAQINRVTRCNGILEVHIRMKDVNIELDNSVTPWEQDEPIDGDAQAAYLNVSDQDITAYDGAASRLYFWTNQPADSVYVLNNANGNSNVNGTFDRIANPYADNLHYDPSTGSGYIDIALLSVAAGQLTFSFITLKAGSLQRRIQVWRSSTVQGRKRITTPYVGTYHKANQVGERIVTWSYSGYWTAYIDEPEGSGAHVLIDRLPSPSFSLTGDYTLYGRTPSDAEMGLVSDNGVNSVSGMNTIYFRVGWDSPIDSTDEPRYATITVRKGINDPNGEKIQTLYLRQGEKPSTVFSANRANTVCFSPYNLKPNVEVSTWPHAVPLNGGRFTDFPTQSGSFFQWMNIEYPRYTFPVYSDATSNWSAVNPVFEPYWTEAGWGLPDTYETCPPGYRRVSDGATDSEPTGTSELRQSLWADPTEAEADNTLTGYYADGFFDRRSTGPNTTTTTYVANSATIGTNAMVTNNDVAYKGRLFFNDDTKASLFFPAAGRLVEGIGSLIDVGKIGYYWTASSTVNTTQPTGEGAYVSTRLRNAGMNIRCVVDEDEAAASTQTTLLLGDVQNISSTRWRYTGVTSTSANPITSIILSMVNNTYTLPANRPSGVEYTSLHDDPLTVLYVFDTPISATQVEDFIEGITFERTAKYGGVSPYVKMTIDANPTSLPDGASITVWDHPDGSLHYYVWVKSVDIHYKDAYNSAKSYYFQGMRGYLPTLTCADESALLTNISTLRGWSGGVRTPDNISDTRNAISAPSSVDSGEGIYYRWICGPETNFKYYQGPKANSNGAGPMNNAFSGWAPGEPNCYGSTGENCMQVNHALYRWNDSSAIPLNIDGISGYFIEFGGNGQAYSVHTDGVGRAYYPVNEAYHTPTSPGLTNNNQWHNFSPGNKATTSSTYKPNAVRSHVLVVDDVK